MGGSEELTLAPCCCSAAAVLQVWYFEQHELPTMEFLVPAEVLAAYRESIPGHLLGPATNGNG